MYRAKEVTRKGIGKVLKPLAISVLITLRLTAAASATVTAIHKKMLGSGCGPSDLALHPLDLASHNATLIISNEEMNDIMKIVKSPEESVLLIKGISGKIKNQAKKQKWKISQNVIRHFRC